MIDFDCSKISNVSEEKLIKQIQDHIKSIYPSSTLSKAIYSKFKVGVTNKTDRRYKENRSELYTSNRKVKKKVYTNKVSDKRLSNWHCWDAGTRERALKVESHFCGKGFTKCDIQKKYTKETKYVYVFRIPEQYLKLNK